MTLDQMLQLWAVIGTWVAGIGTVSAVVVAMYLARRSEKIRFEASVFLGDILSDDGSIHRKGLIIRVTNIGDSLVLIGTKQVADLRSWRVPTRAGKSAPGESSRAFSGHQDKSSINERERTPQGFVNCPTK